MADSSFIHQFIPAQEGNPITLLLLHGTGGDERDLIPVGQALLPGAAVLSPRGRVLENGMPRFFRRFSEGVFDEDDIRLRAGELAEFINGASKVYGFDEHGILAVGYSNGANMAAALLLLRPRVLTGAVLFRAMVPLGTGNPSEPERRLRIPGGGRSGPNRSQGQCRASCGAPARGRRFGVTRSLSARPRTRAGGDRHGTRMDRRPVGKGEAIATGPTRPLNRIRRFEPAATLYPGQPPAQHYPAQTEAFLAQTLSE